MQDIVYYIPGWRGDVKGKGDKDLSRAFPGAQHECFDWPGRMTEILGWPKALLNSDKVWRQLADRLMALSDDERSRVTLVGHSLGARIVVRVLAELGRHRLKVKRGVLLAAAIPNDDPDLTIMGQGSELQILAACNPMDFILKYIYSLFGGESGVPYGTDGSAEGLENVREIAVRTEAKVSPALKYALVVACKGWGILAGLWVCNCIEATMEHFVSDYLRKLQDFLEGKINGYDEPLVVQDCVNVDWKTMNWHWWWDVLDEVDGWELQWNKNSGHCRILDPTGKRRAYGRKSVMRKSFAKIKSRIAESRERSISR